jgi:hypothetical protein
VKVSVSLAFVTDANAAVQSAREVRDLLAKVLDTIRTQVLLAARLPSSRWRRTWREPTAGQVAIGRPLLTSDVPGERQVAASARTLQVQRQSTVGFNAEPYVRPMMPLL